MSLISKNNIGFIDGTTKVLFSLIPAYCFQHSRKPICWLFPYPSHKASVWTMPLTYGILKERFSQWDMMCNSYFQEMMSTFKQDFKNDYQKDEVFKSEVLSNLVLLLYFIIIIITLLYCNYYYFIILNIIIITLFYYNYYNFMFHLLSD